MASCMATVISEFFRHKDVSADRLKRGAQGGGGRNVKQDSQSPTPENDKKTISLFGFVVVKDEKDRIFHWTCIENNEAWISAS